MKNVMGNPTTIMIATLAVVMVLFALPISATGISCWALLFGSLAVVAVVFGIIRVLGERRLPAKEAGYDLLKYDERKSHPRFKFYKRYWGWLFWAVITCCMGSCNYKWTQGVTEEPTVQATVWNADNIPLPHLKDGLQYVSNPDTVLSQSVVDSMNSVLRKLDTELGVESSVIIVGHIENADAFRMAQDVGNKYGVGSKETNRGLVIVVAYEDRKYFIAPGSGLEADLTDAECNQLARAYLTPFMKAGNPGGGMLALVTATYNLLKGKPLPALPDSSQLSSGSNNGDDGLFEMLLAIIMFAWMMIYSGLNRIYRWITGTSNNGTGYTGFGRDRAGTGTVWGTGWNGRGGFGGGFGGGIGGGYGGGSFGGGGAGGSW